MSTPIMTLQGILKPDGTLELAERPSMPAGPVEITIRPRPVEPIGEDPWEYLKRTRAELEALGSGFRTREEIDADIEDMRSWDDKIDELERQRTAEARPDGPGSC